MVLEGGYKRSVLCSQELRASNLVQGVHHPVEDGLAPQEVRKFADQV